MNPSSTPLYAGSAALDITPNKPMALRGYPHVKRFGTGILDPLMVSALYIRQGKEQVLFLANDLILITKSTTQAVRKRIEEKTGIPGHAVHISVTHTHSGPTTSEPATKVSVGPGSTLDPEYMKYWEDRMVEAAEQAMASAAPAEAGLEVASAAGLGTNRHDPSGPSDMEIPVMGVRSREDGRWMACMAVCNIHPTVLHEDSTVYSGDFPGQAREILQEGLLGKNCPFLYHNGVSGNQSPRHVTRENTPAEARRLGGILAKAVEGALARINFSSELPIKLAQVTVPLKPRPLPTVEEADKRCKEALKHFEHLRDTGAPRTEVRTAECDWFGAERTLDLAKINASGELEVRRARAQPMEISAVRLGPWTFVFWPGEWFVEYGLAVKAKCPDTYMITCANGETQGYIVTEQAVAEKRYEATNGVFCYTNGQFGVETTLKLLATLPNGGR